MKHYALTCFTLSLLILASSAQAAKQRNFDNLDINKDAKLSMDEFVRTIATANRFRMRQSFRKRDINDDGFLSKDEYSLQAASKK